MNTTMVFNVPLAKQILYCPVLTCQAYDYIFKGFNQPLIGVFTIPIGQLMHDLIAKREEEVIIMENLIKELEKHCREKLKIQAYNTTASIEKGILGIFKKAK